MSSLKALHTGVTAAPAADAAVVHAAAAAVAASAANLGDHDHGMQPHPKMQSVGQLDSEAGMLTLAFLCNVFSSFKLCLELHSFMIVFQAIC